MGKLRMIWQLAIASAPEPVAALLYAGRRKVVDGRRIDAKAQALGEMFNLLRVPGQVPTLADSRAGLRAMAARFDLPSPPGILRRDLMMPGADGLRPARLYDTDLAATDRPALLFIHGGGWVQGDLDTHDGLCGQLALEAGIRVISIDYRLAPEHKFPAGLEDCHAAYAALRADPRAYGVNPALLAVGGDSAGGNLTAALMHGLQAQGLPLPKAQLLIYPAVDPRMDTRSMRMLKDAYVLPRDRIGWYLDQYLPSGQDRADPRVGPIFSPHLAGQPDTLILVGGQDPLWDDGLSYAEALGQQGVRTTILRYPGQIHVFVSARRAVPQGRHATSAMARWLRETLV